METKQPTKTEQPDKSRRDFIEKAGKAAVAAPAAAILLSGASQSAQANPYAPAPIAPAP